MLTLPFFSVALSYIVSNFLTKNHIDGLKLRSQTLDNLRLDKPCWKFPSRKGSRKATVVVLVGQLVNREGGHACCSELMRTHVILNRQLQTPALQNICTIQKTHECGTKKDITKNIHKHKYVKVKSNTQASKVCRPHVFMIKQQN